MIIHSPEISGSLTLVGGASIIDPVFSGSVSIVGDTGGSEYSGSFSGSFQGDGSQLSGVTSYTDSDTLSYINSQNVVSGSSQIDLSGVNGDTDDVSEGSTNLYYTDARVKTKLDAETVVSSSEQVVDILSSINNFTSSQETKNTTLESVTSSLDQRLDSFESVSASYARTDLNNSFSGLQTFNNINVDGTASFAYIQSTTGSSTSIGEAFILLNENTPSSNFAGLQVVDSGSSFTTSSFVYDGLNNQWVFQHEGTEDSGSSVAIFGPLSQGGLGTEQGLTTNTVPKAVTDHGHHIGDSNITDDGSIVSVTGDFTVSGNITGSSDAQFATVGVGGASDATYELKVTGDIGATGDIVAYISSDERLKDNIELIENPIQKVEQLRGVTWEWNDEASDAAKDSPNVGVIAQDVEKVLPQLVHDRENGYKGVDYSKLTGLLIEAMKEQQQQLDELRERLSELEG